jgi:hypothetical protein
MALPFSMRRICFQEVRMQHIVCGKYSAEIFPIYREWAGKPLYRVAVYDQGELIYEHLEGDPTEAARVAEACIDWQLKQSQSCSQKAA